MKRYIRSTQQRDTSEQKPSNTQKGYKAAEKFKQRYPKAYEVLGR